MELRRSQLRACGSYATAVVSRFVLYEMRYCTVLYRDSIIECIIMYHTVQYRASSMNLGVSDLLSPPIVKGVWWPLNLALQWLFVRYRCQESKAAPDFG